MLQSERITETEIIERIKSGEKSLYEIIVRRYNPYLDKVGRSYNYSHEDILDLMQETFIDAYKSLSQFNGQSSLKTWIIRIMMNNCYRKKKKSSYKNEILREIGENSKPMFMNADNDINKTIQNRELGHIIEEALGRIPFDYRIVFSLREIDGLNVAETASLLNISESNVRVRLNRSKTMLRNEIIKAYSTVELFEFSLVHCDAIVENVMREINKL